MAQRPDSRVRKSHGPPGGRALAGAVEPCKCHSQGLGAGLGGRGAACGRGAPGATSLTPPLRRREPRNLAGKGWRRAVSSANAGKQSCCRDPAAAGARSRGPAPQRGKGVNCRPGQVAPHPVAQLRDCARARGEKCAPKGWGP